jgi:hypothetical protein
MYIYIDEMQDKLDFEVFDLYRPRVMPRSNGKVIRDIFRRGPFKEYHIQDWSNICLVFLKKIEM